SADAPAASPGPEIRPGKIVAIRNPRVAKADAVAAAMNTMMPEPMTISDTAEKISTSADPSSIRGSRALPGTMLNPLTKAIGRPPAAAITVPVVGAAYARVTMDPTPVAKIATT